MSSGSILGQTPIPQKITVNASSEDDADSLTYSIKKGDTLYDIASVYGITVDELIAANPQLIAQGRISSDRTYALIKPGETLNIPSGATLNEDSEYCTYTGENIASLTPEEQSNLQDVWELLNPSSLQEFSTAIVGKINGGIDSITHTISNAYGDFSNSVINAVRRIDPLIIDLNGDGLKLNSWQESGVTFDLNGDGFSESTGWTTASSDDAFLVLDKNSNGNVDNIDELFGNSSNTGFEVLSKFDSNADNLINSTDAQFNLLKLWKDSNANGVVNEGELTSLLENGITEISLKTLNNLYSASGNLITETAEVKITDPNNPDSNTNTSTRTVSEVLFAMNQFNSSIVNPDEALGVNFTLDVNTLLLPYSRGYGSLNSWQVAMTLNSELLETAQTLANLSPSNFYQINSLFETFLFQWADVENVTSSQVYESGSSTKIDHRKVAFLEKATGLDFRVPNDAVISQAQTSWDLFYNTLLARFLTQGTFKEIFSDASYSFSTDTTSINTTLDQAITSILSLSDSLDKSSFLNYAYYAKTILQLNKDQFTSETNTSFDSKVNTMLSSIINSVSIPNFSFNGIFNIGSDANETLYGSNNSDILKGMSGEDFIYAESGNDYIEGNGGSDYLKGGAGDDIYKFNLGDGQDTIEETSGTDKIVFGSGITQTSLAFARIGVDLLISIGSGSDANSSDKIGIKNFYVVGENRVETLEFADGATFNLGALNIVAYGTEANDALYGSNDNDIISGGAGDDLIYTYYGDDIVTGGTGNDYLENYNDTGNDTYIFNLGDGQDVILEDWGSDKIIFGAGITKEDIILVEDIANENSLILKIRNTTDQIRIRMFFQFDSLLRKIETLQFADGTTMSLVGSLSINASNPLGETLVGSAYSDVITGNIGNDVINGGSGNDVLDGGLGDDIIYSGEGDDILTGGTGNDYFESHDWGNETYIFNLGDGQDVIYDFQGSDKIVFGSGISESDIEFTQDFEHENSLIIKVGSGGDQIKINFFFSSEDTQRKIETLEFAEYCNDNRKNETQGRNISLS